MPDPFSTSSAFKEHTYASAITVAAGIKTSFPTSASPQTFTTFNGSLSSSGAVSLPFGQRVTITSTSSSGSYTTNAITVTGTYNSVAQTDTVTPLTANGNESLKTTKPFDTVTSVALPAQVNTSGAWTIGVDDLVPVQPFRRFYVGAAGNVVVKFQDSTTDTVSIAGAPWMEDIIAPEIVGSGTTAFPLRVYA